jgi:hypothetical protein
MAQLTQSLALGVLGAGVVVASLVVAGFALARGPDMSLPTFAPAAGSGGGWFDAPEVSARPSRSDDSERRPARRKHASSGAGGLRFGGKAVCVRLCDGSFFPATLAGAGDAGCASQCPEAPTELYSMTSDHIEDAVSARTGTPYSKLPVAKRFQATHEATCSCHREAVAFHSKELLHDTTLRKGDVVMTADGFRVFEGAGWGPATAQDFVPVAKAGISKAESDELSAMEHASPGLALVSAPTLVAAKSKSKGNVTVDDGPR